MVKNDRNIAFAALDIGTSQIKMGVYCPSSDDKVIQIGNLKNDLIYGISGEVLSDYRVIREKSFILLKELGYFLKKNNVKELYLGICSHVSSLMEWNKTKGTPPGKSFPIWSDTTSCASLDEFNMLMGDGKSKPIIGTFLPQGTNWLLTKLLNRKKLGFSPGSIFLQVGDAIFYELSGSYQTHFSSQISMVNLNKREYAQELLTHLKIDKSFFPVINSDAMPILESEKRLFDFPDVSFVFPSMADLYPALYGLRLRDKEGFMLANTSEQTGTFHLRLTKPFDNFLSISFKQGYINYGSTNTGGNVINWFLTNILNKKITPALLNSLTRQAMTIEPENTPIFIPYIQGERAPLWNNKLKASFHELNSLHTNVHLFRAILESIAFARKRCFNELGMSSIDLIKIGGGSSKNTLWNSIRANVLNKKIAVADEKELSIVGMIYFIMEAQKSQFTMPAVNFLSIDPDPEMLKIYDTKYDKFIKYQNLPIDKI